MFLLTVLFLFEFCPHRPNLVVSGINYDMTKRMLLQQMLSWKIEVPSD